MNILLRILQVLLGIWNLIGGTFTALHYDDLKGSLASDLPGAVWIVICALQILFAIGLIIPGVFGVMPKLTPIAALYLAFNSLLGCALFAQYAGFPGVLWAAVPAALASFIAYGKRTG